MTRRSDRVLLALEILFGVLPITIVGGVYSVLGLLFGSVSLVMSVREYAFGAFPLGFGIFALAASGLIGIVGLWAVIALSAGVRPPTAPTINAALAASAIGALAATVGLLLMVGRVSEHRSLIVYSLVSPIVVLLHRGRSIAKRT
jgi:hypothetical protein